MVTPYNKLVRDRIPEIIQASGRRCEAVPMADGAYRRALLDKLVEEAGEVARADPDQIVSELADLCKVLDALLDAHGIDRNTVVAEQQRRRAERGGLVLPLSMVDNSLGFSRLISRPFSSRVDSQHHHRMRSAACQTAV